MTEFSKIKIPFALALLAAMFAITPLIQKYGTSSYTFFGLQITINFVYLLFCGLLGGTVYFYAVGLVGDRPVFDYINKMGHITYALALIVPPLFLVLYPISMLAELLMTVAKYSVFSKLVEYISSGFISIIASLAVNLIFMAFAARDKKARIERLSDQENHLLTRARQLVGEGYYDLALTESWKAVEVALSKVFEAMGEPIRSKTFHTLLDVARKRELLTASLIEQMMRVRKLRNIAVHTERKVTLVEAEDALGVADKIIASLDKVEERCYFCGEMFSVYNLESDEITGTSVCRDCSKKNPSWKEKLMDMGMDS